MRKLFGTDGIRGVANREPMTAEMALALGRATAQVFKKAGHRHKIVIGKDTRLSGYMFESALAAGICSMGVDVVLLGPLPTPAVAFITSNIGADAGIVISASHNPYHDNGIKIFSQDGYKLPDKTEQEIEDLMFSKELDLVRPPSSEIGKASRLDDAPGRYIVFLKHTLPAQLNFFGLKIVVDCANGATYRVAPAILRELGAEVLAINTEPTGENINLNCGALHPGSLAQRVKKEKADLGLAFDGDGDRLIAVDEKGGIITGDRLLAVCVQDLKSENRLKNNILISTVMSNIGLSVFLEKLGVRQVKAQVGDRYVLEEMKHHNAVLGGEDSGHIIFLEHHTTGDGLLTALQLLCAMKKSGKKLSGLSGAMKVYPQTLINIDVKKKKPLESIPELNKAIKEAEKELGNQGRVLIRYSGTQLMCRVMVEGPTEKIVQEIAARLAALVKKNLS